MCCRRVTVKGAEAPDAQKILSRSQKLRRVAAAIFASGTSRRGETRIYLNLHKYTLSRFKSGKDFPGKRSMLIPACTATTACSAVSPPGASSCCPCASDPALDAPHRQGQGQIVVFGCPSSQATKRILNPFDKGALGRANRPTQSIRDKVDPPVDWSSMPREYVV